MDRHCNWSNCSSCDSLGEIKTWRGEEKKGFPQSRNMCKSKKAWSGVVSLMPGTRNQKPHQSPRDFPTGHSPQPPPSSPSPCCFRCQAGPGASPAVELGSLKGPLWDKPCHVLGLDKRGGAPWLGMEGSRGPGGNFDYGRSALAGILRALVGQALRLLPSRRYTHSSHLENQT